MGKKIDTKIVGGKGGNDEIESLFSQFDEKFMECEEKISEIQKHIDECRDAMDKEEEQGKEITKDKAEGNEMSSD